MHTAGQGLQKPAKIDQRHFVGGPVLSPDTTRWINGVV
jgi:hypothetical protein